MQIVLARIEEDFRVKELRRADMGERPIMEAVPKPVACMWLNNGSDADVAKAQAYARAEGYTVFTYKGSRDPLTQAKKDVMRPGLKNQNAAWVCDYPETD